MPSIITTDRGSQFQSTLFKKFVNLFGVRHIQTTAYQPCANRIVGKFHKHSEMALVTKVETYNWLDSLLIILLSIWRSSVHNTNIIESLYDGELSFESGDVPVLSILPDFFVPNLESTSRTTTTTLTSTPVHERQLARTFISTPRPRRHALSVNQGLNEPWHRSIQPLQHTRLPLRSSPDSWPCSYTNNLHRAPRPSWSRHTVAKELLDCWVYAFRQHQLSTPLRCHSSDSTPMQTFRVLFAQ